MLAALLHDLLEDTAVTPSELQGVFGAQAQRLVEALSFDPTITDRVAQFEERFARWKAAGPDALAIIATDFLNNSFY